MLIGFPVVIAIALPAIVYIFAFGFPVELISLRIHYALDSYPLLAIPIFIYAGNLMNHTGVTDRIFKFADLSVGRVHGGLAQVNIFAGLMFASMSGAALAAVGGLGPVTLKSMQEKGYDKPFAAAVTISSATVGPMFPPSIPFIIYGAVASVSIVKLFLAGIVPSLIIVALLMITTAIIAKIRKYPRSDQWTSFSNLRKSFYPASPALAAPVILVGGLLTGIFTPTEAATVMVVYVILISLFIYKQLKISHLFEAALQTIRTSVSILIIIAAASLFGWILAVEQIPQIFASSILSLTQNPVHLLMIITVLLIIVGMFLDSTTATLLVVPIIAPPLVQAGVDPVHLGVVTILNLMVGLVTPPLGLSLFLISNIAKLPVNQILKGVLPFLIPLLVTLLLITFLPSISLLIPNMLN
ncbi:MAG: TRAP transporter large permease [Bacteroidales bacterium]|nr:TRAP transporter large permease [Bacteroidales bacterium]